MPFGIGVWELAILLLVALLVFGPKRLPEMGRSLGRGMREFKDSVSGNSKDDDDDERDRARELPSTRDDDRVTVTVPKDDSTVTVTPSRERDTA
jgi:sec-independent protein translocase protein TatA